MIQTALLADSTTTNPGVLGCRVTEFFPEAMNQRADATTGTILMYSNPGELPAC